MNKLYDTPKPEGFRTANTYLFVNDAPSYIDFIKSVFLGEELSRTVRPDNGDIANCILSIGDTNIMIAQARGDFENMATAIYLYTSEVDKLYEAAIDAGCESVFKGQDMDYGDYQAGVKDIQGNYWWISKRGSADSY
ncbi:MAG: hypothetical protein ABJG68_11960 [Crocinitomicaceae bacterium]